MVYYKVKTFLLITSELYKQGFVLKYSLLKKPQILLNSHEEYYFSLSLWTFFEPAIKSSIILIEIY